MKVLSDLIQTLKSTEVRFIRKYYNDDTNKKRLQLFDLIYNKEVKSDGEAAKKLYGSKGSAYSQLKGRLLSDLLNLLLFEDGEKQSSTELIQAEIEVKRLMLQSRICTRRGNKILGIKLAQKAKDYADEFELVHDNIGISDFLSIQLGQTKGYEEYADAYKEINQLINNLDKQMLAKNFYNSLLFSMSQKKNNEDDYSRLSSLAMYKLKTLNEEENESTNISYLYYLSAINFHSLSRNYNEVENFAIKLIKLLEDNKSVYMYSRMANAYLQLYYAYIHKKEYDKAIETLEGTSSDFKLVGGSNTLAIYEFIFLAAVQLEDLIKMEEVLEFASNNSKRNATKFISSKWDFYTAIFNFINKNYDNTLVELAKESELLKDKSGWLFGHKLLEIMTYVEQGEYDMIDFRIEALRKLLQRQKHKNITRIKAILKVLNTLVKTGYSFSKTAKKERDLLENLEQALDEYYWDPLGYELVRFDKWFQKKA